MQRMLAVLLAVVLVGVLAGCGATDPGTTASAKTEGARVTPTVGGGESEPDGPPIVTAPQDVRQLSVGIADGQFSHERYDVQAGSTRLLIAVSRGPYTLSIDQVLQPTDLPETGSVEIEINVDSPGEHQMQVVRPGETQPADTAVLNVRGAGAR